MGHDDIYRYKVKGRAGVNAVAHRVDPDDVSQVLCRRIDDGERISKRDVIARHRKMCAECSRRAEARKIPME